MRGGAVEKGTLKRLSSQGHYRTTSPEVPASINAKTCFGRNWFLRVEHQQRVLDEYGARIGLSGLAIYHVLCLYANSLTAQTFVSRRTICEKAKAGPCTVREAIGKLAKERLISIARGRGTAPTLYTLLPLPENRDDELVFESIAVPLQYHKPEAVVLKTEPSGTETSPLRYSERTRNKDERTVLTNRINEPPPTPQRGGGVAAAPLSPAETELQIAADKLLTHYGWYSPLFTEAIHGAFVSYSSRHPTLSAAAVAIELQAKWRRHREKYRKRDPSPLSFFQQGKYLDDEPQQQTTESPLDRLRKQWEA